MTDSRPVPLVVPDFFFNRSQPESVLLRVSLCPAAHPHRPHLSRDTVASGQVQASRLRTLSALDLPDSCSSFGFFFISSFTELQFAYQTVRRVKGAIQGLFVYAQACATPPGPSEGPLLTPSHLAALGSPKPPPTSFPASSDLPNLRARAAGVGRGVGFRGGLPALESGGHSIQG